jgi:hypothetical protein
MDWVISFRFVFPLVSALTVISGCKGAYSTPQTAAIPIDLKETVDTFSRAIEALDLPVVLDTYAEGFTSGTGRTKDEIRHVLTRLRENRVILEAISVVAVTREMSHVSDQQSNLSSVF